MLQRALRLAVVAGLVVASSMAGLPLAGGQTIVIEDFCTGTSHTTDRLVVLDERTGQVVDPFSVQTFGVTADGVPPGSFFTLEVAPPGGSPPAMATGLFDPSGRAVADLPLFEFGDYTPNSVQIVGDDGQVLNTIPIEDLFPSGGFTVGPDEPVCNRQSLPFASSFMPPVGGISQVLGSIGLTPDEIAMVVEWGVIGVDGLLDWFRFSARSGLPTIDGPFGDIVTAGSSQVTFDASGDSPLALSCSDPGVACGGVPPNLMGGDYHVLWFTTAGPFPTDAPYQRQLAIVFNDSIGVPWVFGNPFIYDTFNGAAIWIFVDTAIGSTVPVLSSTISNGPNSASPISTDSFAIVGADTFALFVPRSEFPSITGYGAALHFHDGSFGFNETDLSVLDSAPDTNGPWLRGPGDLFVPMPVGDMDHIVTGIVPPPPVIDEPTDDPADTPVDEPTDDPRDTPTDEPADDPADDPRDTPVDDPADDPTDVVVDDPPVAVVDDPTGPPATTDNGGGGGALVPVVVVVGVVVIGGVVIIRRRRPPIDFGPDHPRPGGREPSPFVATTDLIVPAEEPHTYPSPVAEVLLDPVLPDDFEFPSQLPPGRQFDDDFLRQYPAEDAKWELEEADYERWKELQASGQDGEARVAIDTTTTFFGLTMDDLDPEGSARLAKELGLDSLEPAAGLLDQIADGAIPALASASLAVEKHLADLRNTVADGVRNAFVWAFGETRPDGTKTPGIIERGFSLLSEKVKEFLESIASSPAKPTTKITVRAAGGGDSVTKEQRFQIVVEVPRGSRPPAETIVVEFHTADGKEDSVTLAWNKSTRGPVVYTSKPLSMENGGDGAATRTLSVIPKGVVSYLPQSLQRRVGKLSSELQFEMSKGDMDGFSTKNGEKVTIRFGGEETSVRVYTTWVQQGIARSLELLDRHRLFWTGVSQKLAGLEETPQIREFRARAAWVAYLAWQAGRMNDSDQLDTTKLAYIETLLDHVKYTPGGMYSEGELIMQISTHYRSRRERYGDRVLIGGMSQVALGFYQTVLNASPAASAWTLFHPDTDPMGKKITWDKRVLAALEFGGWLALGAGAPARNIARGFGATKRVDDVPLLFRTDPKGGKRAIKPPPSSVPKRAPGDGILDARAGTRIAPDDLADFGMRETVARHFQAVADKFGLRIRVRAANKSSLRWMREGHPPKHVKLKSKTINDTDVQLGAKPGSQGQVGYFKPKMPADFDKLPKDVQDKLTKRFKQRFTEYHDNFKDMKKLQDKGLVEVKDGIVVDRGLSQTRLNPATGELEKVPGAKPGGTGKGFTGDHDMWDVRTPDGKKITKADPDAWARKERAMRELMDPKGPANVQHGCHKDWVPGTPRDKGIDEVIRGSHRGQRAGDGSIGPERDLKSGSPTEALIEFEPGAKSPSTSYEMGDS